MAKKRGSASRSNRTTKGSTAAKRSIAKPIGKPTKLTRSDKPEQYRKIAGDPARRYQKVGGRKVISRRQHDALLAREGAAKAAPPKQFGKHATSRYWELTRAYRKEQASGQSLREVSKSAEYKTRLREFTKSKNNAADGPRAKFLVDIGWRDAGATYKVGETPRKFKKAS